MTSTCRPVSRAWSWLLIAVLAGGFAALARPAAAQTPADHLIFSEVVTTVQRTGARFIEIVNPTGADVPMGNVHLTNGTYRPNEAGYWRLVEPGATGAVAGGGVGGTFHGRFPDGYVLAAGDTLVVAVTGSAVFEAAYGHLPDFEIFEDGAVPDAVPELIEVFPRSINANVPAEGGNAVTLGSVAGSLVLYAWDGTSDLVADLDYVHWGTNQAYRVDKSGVTYGSSTYLADTPVATQTPLPGSAADGRSYLRTTAEEGTEATPGNGATGHDETSENLATTWSVVTPQAPAAAPAVWWPAAPIFSGAVVEPASPREGVPTEVTVGLVSATTITSVELHYAVDGGAPEVVTAVASGGGWTATVPSQLEGTVVTWWTEAANDGGATAVHPAAAPRFTAGWTTRPASGPGDAAAKLLITEINAGVNFYPSYSGIEDLAMEFIELHNPNPYDVDLSDYYITDAVSYVSGEQLYWQIAAGLPSSYDLVGGGNYNDFTARFPDAYTIAAGATIVIAIAGSGPFFSVYGVEPDLELYEDGAEADDIPDLRPVFGNAAENSIYTPGRPASSDGLPRGIPELEEFYGEPVILFHWQEGDDLVTDVDVFMFGDEKDGNFRVSFDKTGVTFGSSAYAADTPVADQTWYQTLDQTGERSYVRIYGDHVEVLCEPVQRPSGSNGVDGRDETSENWPETFVTRTPSPRVYEPQVVPDVPCGDITGLQVPAKTFLPTRGEEFPIRIPERTGSETRLRIFDLDGRVVVTLWDSRFETTGSPPDVIYWDGRDANYELVRGGMYVVHLSVVSVETGEEENWTAPVVVATRLSK